MVVGVLIAAILIYSLFFNKDQGEVSTGLVSGNTAQPVALANPNVVSGVEIGQEFVSLTRIADPCGGFHRAL